MRWMWLIGGGALVALGLVGCASVLPKVQLDPNLGVAPPPLLGAFEGDAPVETLADWENRRTPLLRRAFVERVYGPYPSNTAPARVLSRDAIAYPPLAEEAVLEQWSVAVGGEDRPLHFNMMLVLPRGANAATPIIVMQNFCGNRAAFPNAPDAIAGPLTPVIWACNASWMQPITELPLGRYINGPPYEQALLRGYGLALFYAGDVVGDEAESARAGLVQLYGEDTDQAGAIAVWAWLYSQAYDVLAADPRIDASRIAIWGHSRNGKAALLAGAMDPRIAAVIAHQSGRGGASLAAGTGGESIAEMMASYPWWFPASFGERSDDPAFDQHQLLALIAPRPMFLGNATRDAWSDPNAAWQAARAADPIYRLYGVSGLTQQDMLTPGADANIAYFARPGLHGVTSADWRAFLDFLDAHLRTPAP